MTTWNIFRRPGVLAYFALVLLAMHQKAEALVVTPLTQFPNQSSLSGFSVTAWAGNGAGQTEFGLGDPQSSYINTNGVDINPSTNGRWTWNTPYTMTVTNTSGLYGLSLLDATSQSYATGFFAATTSYTDLVFTVDASPRPQAGVMVSNVSIDGAIVGDLAAGQVEPQLFQGFQVSGAGNSWQTITATITFIANPMIPPSDANLNFQINGLAAPDPSVATASLFRSAHLLATDGSQDFLTPSGDGVPNIYKFAFNMIGSGLGQATTLYVPNRQSAGASGTAGLPFSETSVNGQTQLRWTFIRRKASTSPGITYLVEFCDDLATNSWGTNPSATESTVDIDSTFERVTVTDSVTGAAKRFSRVRVTAP